MISIAILILITMAVLTMMRRKEMMMMIIILVVTFVIIVMFITTYRCYKEAQVGIFLQFLESSYHKNMDYFCLEKELM